MQSAKSLELILRALVYIEEHLEETLSLERISEIAGISPFHFHRIFRALSGETVQSYICRLRMEYAKGALLFSEKTVTEIGGEVGYENPSAFTKRFTAETGMAPSRYRQESQRIREEIFHRTEGAPPDWIRKVAYVCRKEEEVLFVRRRGDYQRTPEEAFTALFSFVEREKVGNRVKAVYGMGLDDPHVVEEGKLRFDACVSFTETVKPKGEVGKKIFPSMFCALFVYQGSYDALEKAFSDIFRYWYPRSRKELSPLQPVCEFCDLRDRHAGLSEGTVKIYIPLIG